MLGASSPFVSETGRLRLKVEIKAAFRDSRDLSLTVPNTGTPFPIVLRTVDPGAHTEVPNLGLTLECDLTPGIFVRAVVDVLDLYNRNPTSSADKVLLREAFVRFGKKSRGPSRRRRDERIPPARQGPAVLEADRAPARELRPLGNRRRALRGDRRRGGGLLRPARLLARERDGRHAALFPRPERPRGRQRDARAHRRLDDARRLQLGISDPLRHGRARRRRIREAAARRRRRPAVELGRERARRQSTSSRGSSAATSRTA